MFFTIGGFAFLLSVLFLLYLALILVPFLRDKPVVPGDPDDFHWHFFIPCRDEEAVIATTIERARTNFPNAHLWVIDDDSDDETLAIAEEYARFDPHVHVVARKRPNARLGKGAALNQAYAELSDWLPARANRDREIVIVLDADGELAENALEVVSSDSVFGDDENGAAQITVWMKNRDDKNPVPGGSAFKNRFGRLLIRMQDMEFRTVNAAMQSLRSRAGTVGLGGNGQFTRLSILDRIGEEYGTPWHGSLLEDYELGLHVVLTGSTTKNVNDTHVSQEALPSMKRFVTQRTRWAQGNIECVGYIPKVVKSPYVTAAGALETTYYLLLPYLQTLGMIALALLGFSALLDGLSHPEVMDAFVRVWWSVLTIYIVFTLAPFVLWGPIYRKRCEPDLDLATSIRYGFCFALYIYYMYLVLPAAFVRKYSGKTGWAKTRRNGEVAAKGAAVAVEH